MQIAYLYAGYCCGVESEVQFRRCCACQLVSLKKDGLVCFSSLFNLLKLICTYPGLFLRLFSFQFCLHGHLTYSCLCGRVQWPFPPIISPTLLVFVSSFRRNRIIFIIYDLVMSLYILPYSYKLPNI